MNTPRIKYLIRSMYSSSKRIHPQQQTKMKYKALWAQKIATTLASHQIKNYDGCLVKYIPTLELEKHFISQNQKEIEQYAKQQIMKMFKPGQGTELPQNFYSTQQRYQDALNLNKKMTFYPNKIATPIIFQTIQQVSQSNVKRMIVGKPGISKSMSFILAWKLSQIVSEFRYKCPQLAQKIIQSKQLDQKFRKIIYVNFKIENHQNYFASLIAQCPQFQQELQKIYEQYQTKVLTLSNNHQIIQFNSEMLTKLLNNIRISYHQKKIQCLTVMDQINTVASAIKKHSIAKKISQNKPDGSQQKENAKKAYQKMSRLYNIFYTVFLNMRRFIYNSSANIQPAILGPPNKKYPLTLDLNHHSPIQMIECSFNQQSYKTFAEQLYYFFLYEIEKRLHHQNLKAKELEEFNRKQSDNKSVKQKVQAILSKMAKQSEFVSFITPYSIRMAVSKNFDNLIPKLLSKQAKEQQLQECIKQLINKTIIIGKSFILNKVKIFVEGSLQQEDIKIGILTACWIKLKENQTKEDYKFQITFSQIKGYIYQYNRRANKPHKNIQLQQFIDNDLFKRQFQILRLKVSQKQFEQIIENYIISLPKYVPIVLRMLMDKNSMSALGSILEGCFIHFVENNSQHSTVRIGGTDYKMLKTFKFIHYLNYEKTKLKITNQKRYKEILDIELPQLTYVGFPITQQEKSSPNNPTFDVHFITKNKNGKLSVRSFDFTLNSQPKKLQDKVTAAIRNIQSWMDGIFEDWTHVILCRPDMVTKHQQKGKKKKNVVVIFKSITDLAINVNLERLGPEPKQVYDSLMATIEYIKKAYKDQLSKQNPKPNTLNQEKTDVEAVTPKTETPYIPQIKSSNKQNKGRKIIKKK